MAPSQKLSLSPDIATVVDIGRLVRELDGLEVFLTQAAVREAGTPVSLPRTTKTLDDVARQNDLNLLNKEERGKLKDFLEDIRVHAPVVHISFSADPSEIFLKKIITWFRTEAHPFVLLQVGLQPSIAAGCVVRTPNKYFDFSLRRHFTQQRQVLVDKISGQA